MKYLLISGLFICLFFCSCGKIIPNLERNNPYDTSYAGNNADKIRILEYYSHNVACKYSNGATITSEENTIKPGDRIFLQIRIKNPSNFDIEKVRATFSCTSTYIQLKQISAGYFVRLSEGSSYIDHISSGKIGWSEITNGRHFSFAPNYNSYAIEFLVSTTANVGSSFTIHMYLKDNFNNSWNENINLKVQ